MTPSDAAELLGDLAAGGRGLELEHRWGGWAREPFTADSALHVSVYARPS